MVKSCYLDSNICIAFLQRVHPFHHQSVELMKSLVNHKSALILSPLTLDETIHILVRDARMLKVPQSESKIKRQIVALFKLPRISLLNPPDLPKLNLRIFSYLMKYKLKPRDAYHLLIMKFHKIKHFATFDSDFNLVFVSKRLNHFNPS